MFYNDLNTIIFKRSKQMNNILIIYSTTDGHTLTISKTIANYLKTNSNISITPLINCTKADLRVFRPSYLAYIIPSIAVTNINVIVVKAPICEPIFMNKYISIIGTSIMAIRTEFICL